MRLFGTRCFSCRPIRGGFYQRQDAIEPIPYELNDFIQETGKSSNTLQNKPNDKTYLWNCRSLKKTCHRLLLSLNIDWSVVVEDGETPGHVRGINGLFWLDDLGE